MQHTTTVARPIPTAPATITALHRVRTAARLERAGLSSEALATILPDWYASVAAVADRIDAPLVLALGDA